MRVCVCCVCVCLCVCVCVRVCVCVCVCRCCMCHVHGHRCITIPLLMFSFWPTLLPILLASAPTPMAHIYTNISSIMSIQYGHHTFSNCMLTSFKSKNFFCMAGAYTNKRRYIHFVSFYIIQHFYGTNFECGLCTLHSQDHVKHTFIKGELHEHNTVIPFE